MLSASAVLSKSYLTHGDMALDSKRRDPFAHELPSGVNESLRSEPRVEEKNICRLSPCHGGAAVLLFGMSC